MIAKPLVCRCAARPAAPAALMCQLRHTHHSTLLSLASGGLEHDREDFGMPEQSKLFAIMKCPKRAALTGVRAAAVVVGGAEEEPGTR
jgi:hypothetical protein